LADRKPPYKKAPITEAVIELRVKLPDGTAVDDLQRLQALLPSSYGAPVDIYEDVTTIEIRPGKLAPIAHTTRTHQGYRFAKTDESRVLQAKLGGFTYSALAPYESWETFCPEARGLWELYRETFHPTSVTRVAVRYINRIDIPLNVVDSRGQLELEDYFKTYPQITEELPHHTMAGFVMQVPVPQPDIESILLLKQGVVPPPRPEVFSVLLDLDIFREVTWEPNDDETIWGFLETLRKRKNQAFEASITDATRELFD
jgi:uncharacterized protein (TIGR04255 family)